MFSLEGLNQQLLTYQNQQKQAEQLFHQCAGIIAFLTQQINLLKDKNIKVENDLPTMESKEHDNGRKMDSESNQETRSIA